MITAEELMKEVEKLAEKLEGLEVLASGESTSECAKKVLAELGSTAGDTVITAKLTELLAEYLGVDLVRIIDLGYVSKE